VERSFDSKEYHSLKELSSSIKQDGGDAEFVARRLELEIETEKKTFFRFCVGDILYLPFSLDPFECAEQFHGSSGNPKTQFKPVLQPGIFDMEIVRQLHLETVSAIQGAPCMVFQQSSQFQIMEPDIHI
jgi:hypothetical protein